MWKTILTFMSSKASESGRRSRLPQVRTLCLVLLKAVTLINCRVWSAILSLPGFSGFSAHSSHCYENFEVVEDCLSEEFVAIVVCR